jgi:hypothetical protein
MLLSWLTGYSPPPGVLAGIEAKEPRLARVMSSPTLNSATGKIAKLTADG